MTKPRAHFLHIGKTGGTAVKKGLQGSRDVGRYEIVLHPHTTTLDNVPAGEKVFFVLRHPVTRFVSGFNSRMRRGRPRYDYPWSEAERHAFTCFRTPNELAEALSDDDDTRRRNAQRAMRGIRHVCHSVWCWFREPSYFFSRSDDVLFVGFQESLQSDFERLAEVLGLADRIALPTDPLETHRTPGHFDRSLSRRGMDNLLIHYARDVEFYEQMKTIHAGR